METIFAILLTLEVIIPSENKQSDKAVQENNNQENGLAVAKSNSNEIGVNAIVLFDDMAF